MCFNCSKAQDSEASVDGMILDESVDYLGLGRWAVETPQAEALAAPGREPLSYAALWDHVLSTSAALHRSGLPPGGVALLALPSGPEFVTATLAITLQSVCAPVDLGLTQDECQRLLNRLDGATVVYQEGVNSPLVEAARQQGLRLISLRFSCDARAGIFTLAEVEKPVIEKPTRHLDMALLFHTSATTGIPKLVPRSRLSVRAASLQNARALQLSASDRFLSLMPLCYSHGISAVFSQLICGGTVFCTPEFEADSLPAWLEQFRPTWFSASPAVQRSLLALAQKSPGIFQRIPLRFIRSAGAAPEAEVLLAQEKLLGVPVLDGYGLTEAPSVARNTLEHCKPGSVGRSVGPQVAIMDDSGSLLPPDTEGEVVLRGPTVMPGYLDDPDANQSAFRNGWFRTGDLGRLDRDGFLFIVGRSKEMINRGGRKVVPQEVDAILATHPAVADVAAFSIPHRSLGEDVAAAVVLREGAGATQAELRRFAAEHLAAYKVPRHILLVHEISRTATGKTKRSTLAEQYRALGASGALAPGSSPTHRLPDEVEAQIIAIWRRILSVEQAGLEDNFFELGGDSLSAAAMLAEIETTLPGAHHLDASAFFDEPTVACLARILRATISAPAGKNQGVRTLLLQQQGTRSPFFCFSSNSFNPYELRHLAQYLGSAQPFVSVCPPPPAQAQRLLTPREIARQAVDSIRALQKHGPYLLGGYCYGGVVAFETALQLLAEGEEVALLALFDTPTPGYPKVVRSWRRYAQAAAGLLRSLLKGEVTTVTGSVIAHLQFLRHLARRKLGHKVRHAVAPLEARSPQTDSWSSLLMRQYQPRALPAPIVQFLAAGEPVSSRVLTDRRLGWQDFAAKGFHACPVPGDHISLLEEVNAPVLAAELERVLAGATASVSRLPAHPLQPQRSYAATAE